MNVEIEKNADGTFSFVANTRFGKITGSSAEEIYEEVSNRTEEQMKKDELLDRLNDSVANYLDEVDRLEATKKTLAKLEKSVRVRKEGIKWQLSHLSEKEGLAFLATWEETERDIIQERGEKETKEKIKVAIAALNF